MCMQCAFGWCAEHSWVDRGPRAVPASPWSGHNGQSPVAKETPWWDPGLSRHFVVFGPWTTSFCFGLWLWLTLVNVEHIPIFGLVESDSYCLPVAPQFSITCDIFSDDSVRVIDLRMWLETVLLLLAIASPTLSFRPYVTCVGCETFLQCFLTCPVADYPGVNQWVSSPLSSELCFLLVPCCSTYFSPSDSVFTFQNSWGKSPRTLQVFTSP